MNITFISDYLPCPPNNGVALPLYNLLKGLKKNHEISYLYLNDGTRGPLTNEMRAENAKLVELEIVSVRRLPRLNRIFNEIFQMEPYFHGFDLRATELPDKALRADVYFFSPFTVWPFSRVKGLNQGALKIAWINDSSTAMMRSRVNYLGMKSIPIGKKFHFISQWLRSFYMGSLETAALRGSDLIFVQTATEKNWIDRISGGQLNEKVRIVTNGVNDVLFQRDVETGRPSFLFFGDMSGIYDELVIWLLKNVWPILRDSVADSTFSLVGKNASDKVLKIVRADARIHYRSFIENIEDVFAGQGVMLAPVYKDFGVINKVLESMAAGVPVVGDRTAFNGIQGFEAGVHGFVEDSAEDVAASAKLLMEDVVLYKRTAIQARSLMKEKFSWGSRIECVDQYIEEAAGWPK